MGAAADAWRWRLQRLLVLLSPSPSSSSSSPTERRRQRRSRRTINPPTPRPRPRPAPGQETPSPSPRGRAPLAAGDARAKGAPWAKREGGLVLLLLLLVHLPLSIVASARGCPAAAPMARRVARHRRCRAGALTGMAAAGFQGRRRGEAITTCRGGEGSFFLQPSPVLVVGDEMMGPGKKEKKRRRGRRLLL